MKTKFKILSTGSIDNGGICYSLSKIFPQIVFISRSNGFNLATDTGIEKFKSIINNFNVFINHSQISINDDTEEKLIGAQETLLKIAYSNCFKGHVITIGSVLEFSEWEFSDPIIAEEKRQLRETSLKLNCENFKTTHLIVSGFNRYTELEDGEVKLHPDDIALVIKNILESNLDFPLLYIEKTNDERIKKWRDIKKNFDNQ